MIDFILITRKLKKKINKSTLMKILKDTKTKLLNLAIIYFLRLKFAYLV